MPELLGTNRGFELNSLSQFTATNVADGQTATTTVITGNAHSGTYSCQMRSYLSAVTGAKDNYETLWTDKVDVVAGETYRFSCWSKQVTYSATQPDNDTLYFYVKVKWYNSSDTLIQTDTITEVLNTSSYRENTAELVAPATATKVQFEVRNRIVKTTTINPHTYELTITVDDFSIIYNPRFIPQVIWM